MFIIKDANKPSWQSFTYPARCNAERDILVAQAYAHANGLPIPPLYIYQEG